MRTMIDSRFPLLRGQLLSAPFAWPFTCRAHLCELRPCFLTKGRVGKSHRAIARNGRVLLASNRPLTELDGTLAQMRLQTWHKASLPNDPPRLHGILVCVRVIEGELGTAEFDARIVSHADCSSPLALDIGGRRWLEFRRVGA